MKTVIWYIIYLLASLLKHLNIVKEKLLLVRNKRNFTVMNAHQPIPKNLIINFYVYLYNFGLLTSARNSNSNMKTRHHVSSGDGIQHRYRISSVGHIAYQNVNNFKNIAVIVFLFLCTLRWATLYYLPDDDKRLYYLGDPTSHFGGIRQHHLIPLAISANMFAMTAVYFNYRKSKLNWLKIIQVLQGDVSANTININDRNRMNSFLYRSHLAFVIAALGYIITNVATAPIWALARTNAYTNWIDAIIVGIPWMLFEFGYVYYGLAEGFIVASMFYIVCNALTLCQQELNQQIQQSIIVCKSSTTITLRRRRRLLKTINKIIDSHFEICSTIRNYNRFWSEYIFIAIVHILPTNVVFKSQLIFSPMENLYVICFKLTATLNCAIFILLFTYSAASVSKEVRKSYKKLTSLVVAADKVTKIPVRLRLKVRLKITLNKNIIY